MKCLGFYKWIAGSKNDFLKQFQDNEHLLKQAKKFINDLDKSSITFIIAFLVISLLAVLYYYGPYNNRPGRHYRPIHWLKFFGLAFVFSFAATFGIEYIIATPKLNGTIHFELMVALGNALYSSLGYLIFSMLWIGLKMPTNAYRPF